MFATIVLIALALAVLAALAWGIVYRPTGRNPMHRGVPFGIAAALAVLLTCTVFLTCTARVEAKNTGIVTTFGKPSGASLDAGLHLKAPWQDVTQVDGTIQPDVYEGDSAITGLILGDGSAGSLSATIRWRVVPERAPIVFADYRSDAPTETLRTAVVDTQFRAAAAKVLADYNPIARLNVVDADKAQTAAALNFAPDLDAISTALEAEMDARLGAEPLVTIESITVSKVGVSAATQAKVDEFMAAVGETRIAAQRTETAAKEAATNEALAASVSNTPGVLTSKCLDLVKESIATGALLPAGFTCWPGAGSAVVVPSAR